MLLLRYKLPRQSRGCCVEIQISEFSALQDSSMICLRTVLACSQQNAQLQAQGRLYSICYSFILPCHIKSHSLWGASAPHTQDDVSTEPLYWLYQPCCLSCTWTSIGNIFACWVPVATMHFEMISPLPMPIGGRTCRRRRAWPSSPAPAQQSLWRRTQRSSHLPCGPQSCS